MAVTPWLLLVMVLANVGKHHRKLSFALLSQTVQLMLIPSYMAVSMLIAYPSVRVSLVSACWLLRRVAMLLCSTIEPVLGAKTSHDAKVRPQDKWSRWAP